MKKYFLYELKKNAYIIGVIALVMTVIYILPILSVGFFSRSAGGFVWLISTLGGFLALGVPLRVFSYRMKKRSVDLYYSLPLPHLKILTVKYLIGLIAVFAPYTVAFWIGMFVDTMNLGVSSTVYYIPQFFASLIPIYFIYAIVSFIFTRANSSGDGAMFVIFWAFVVTLVISVLEGCTTKSYHIWDSEFHYWNWTETKYYFYPYCFQPYAPLDFVTTHFQRLIRGGYTINYNFETAELVNLILGFSITTLMAAGSTAGLFLLERKTKAENAGQISESLFGYKVMLPLYTALLAGVCDSYLLLIMIAIGSYLLTAAYRRTLKIGKKQAIIWAISMAVGFILFVILYYHTDYIYLDPPVPA